MGRNKYIGSWEDPNLNRIALKFTLENAKKVLSIGLDLHNGLYTHKDISEWCFKYYAEYIESESTKGDEKVLDVMLDVDAQWDLYLSNTYTLEELQALDFDKVYMPKDWFINWLSILNEL